MSHITDMQRYTISVMLEQGFFQKSDCRDDKKGFKSTCRKSAQRKKRFSLARKFTKGVEQRVEYSITQGLEMVSIVLLHCFCKSIGYMITVGGKHGEPPLQAEVH